MKFDFHNPTRLVFGAGSLSRLGAESACLGRRALVVIGGGSVRRSGALDRALASLGEAGIEATVFEGIEPNPRLGTVVTGADVARDTHADFVVALGGGSVMDGAKVIAAGVFYDGDFWDMMFRGATRPRLPQRALPVVTVPTLAATGSEMNSGAVITNLETTEKAYVAAPCLYPALAVVDPELTISVPPDQTAYGVADLMTHVTESYFNGVEGTPLQDRMAEGVLLTALEFGPRAVRDGSDLEARTQIQWASIVALNGWLQAGCGAPFPVHGIEHVLSAHHDIAHGAGLAILSPGWMRWAAARVPGKFARAATRVFAVESAGRDDASLAVEFIDRLEAFLSGIGCPTRLSHAGIGSEGIPRYAEDSVRLSGNGKMVFGRPPLTLEDVIELLKSVA
jgi:alcohol dehydrogenase